MRNVLGNSGLELGELAGELAGFEAGHQENSVDKEGFLDSQAGVGLEEYSDDFEDLSCTAVVDPDSENEIQRELEEGEGEGEGEAEGEREREEEEEQKRAHLRNYLEEILEKQAEVEKELMGNKIEMEKKELMLKNEYVQVQSNMTEQESDQTAPVEYQHKDASEPEFRIDVASEKTRHLAELNEAELTQEIIDKTQSATLFVSETLEKGKRNCGAINELTDRIEQLEQKKELTLLNLMNDKNSRTETITQRGPTLTLGPDPKPYPTDGTPADLEPCFIFCKEETEIKVYMDSVAKIQFLVDALRYLECLRQVKKLNDCLRDQFASIQRKLDSVEKMCEEQTLKNQELIAEKKAAELRLKENQDRLENLGQEQELNPGEDEHQNDGSDDLDLEEIDRERAQVAEQEIKDMLRQAEASITEMKDGCTQCEEEYFINSVNANPKGSEGAQNDKNN